MTTEASPGTTSRVPLSRERVFQAAVEYADEHGIAELSMRKLGQELGVEAMSLYHHVKNKDEVLDGMVDVVAAGIRLVEPGTSWKTDLREQILEARRAMKSHPWAPGVIEIRKTMSFPMMRYMESVAGIMRGGGFSVDLLHHAMHALGARLLGFNQELFDDSEGMDVNPEVQAVVMQQMVEQFPNISAVVAEVQHQDETIVGSGCDDDIEFAFSLDILLDGLERIRAQRAAVAR